MKRYINIFWILILVISNQLLGQTGKWEIIGNMPVGLSSAEVIAGDSLIYILGGYSDSLQNSSNKIYAFDPDKKKWSIVGQLNRKRRNFIADKWENKLYSTTGENLGHSRYVPIESFSLGNYSTGIVDSNRKFDRSRSSGLIHDGIFYLIGGISFGPPQTKNDFIIEYDIADKEIVYEYDSLYSGSRMMFDQMSSFVNENIYLFGGLFNIVSNQILSYNIKKHSLTKLLTQMLQPRAGGRAVKLGDSNIVIVIGGYNEKNYTMNSVESYQMIDNNNIIRKVLPSLNFKRRDLMAVYFKNKIYVFGGTNDVNDAVLPVEVYPLATGVNDEEGLTPTNFELKQNYPNPFGENTISGNTKTIIDFNIGLNNPKNKSLNKTSDNGAGGYATLKIYDILGNVVETLINKEMSQGNYSVEFDGSKYSSGIYLYELIVGNLRATKKMMLIR